MSLRLDYHLYNQMALDRVKSQVQVGIYWS